MRNDILTKVALRYHALYIDIDRDCIDMTSEISAPVLRFLAFLKDTGFCADEELLHALNALTSEQLHDIVQTVSDVMCVNHNWTPLMADWTQTHNAERDQFAAFLFNLFDSDDDYCSDVAALPCGHHIPTNFVNLSRYNGCPLCGTQFRQYEYAYKGQGSRLRELRLFTLHDLDSVMLSLLSSPVPLDGTQKESLCQLIEEFGLPKDIAIPMKETRMVVVKTLVDAGKAAEATALLNTPSDILRYLWFDKTGLMQIIEPRTLIAHAGSLYSNMIPSLNRKKGAEYCMKRFLKLKYGRRECSAVALWLNALPMSAEQAAEQMNPKREMWVRMIHSLRLGEYSRRDGFGHLAKILDVFYKKEYITWRALLNEARLTNNKKIALDLLKQRPGVFARDLFSTMLWFGPNDTIKAFEEIADKLPARLLLSLANAAEAYFDGCHRVARPITGVTHRLEANKMLESYNRGTIKLMKCLVRDVYLAAMKKRFAATPTDNHTMWIDPQLYNIPVAVGDRTTTIQDTSCALMGTRFPVEGDKVRLFLQWGKGLHHQHLDMDLSCAIAYPYSVQECAYYHLSALGAKHSGDIQYIPEMVGTAEYIELDIARLRKAGAIFVTFTCNAYTNGSLEPNLVVGWMDSANEMKVSKRTGVAYDPSCVQHMVRVGSSSLDKGLVFGVLDVIASEIIWLEMPFTGQTLKSCDLESVGALLLRLSEKATIGELLEIKAEAQGMRLLKNAESADERYTYEWALNPADVSGLLLPE